MAQISTAESVINSTPVKAVENRNSKNKYLVPFVLVTCLFFLWGMAHNLDSILVPHLKKACELNNRQSSLVDSAVFFAYFLMAIPAGLFIKKWGFKSGIITGLLVFAFGAFLFVPAANTRSFEFFLVALFVIGCGLAMLETASNPYAAILGPAESAGTRLNLAASFNGLAAFVAPLIGTAFILSGIDYTGPQLAAMTTVERVAYLNSEASSVKLPYIILGCILLLVAFLFSFFHFPEVHDNTKIARAAQFLKTLKRRHLRWAVFAQFAYVGAQVCVTSFFIRMALQGGGLDEKMAGYYLGIYGLLFMAGRFAGTFFLKFISSQKLLSLYSIISVLLCLMAIMGKGGYVIYSLGALGFFMSIMFPTIFTLGIAELGNDTKTGSSLLVMSVVGGAVFPYIMGTMIDLNHDDIQTGYIIPLLCFIIILFFGLIGYKVKVHSPLIVLD